MMERLQKIDRRIIFAGLMLMIAIPLVKPLQLPVNISSETRAAYDLIEALPSGSNVLIATSIFPSTQAELEPQTIAMLNHLVKKQAKIVMAPCYPDTPPYLLKYAKMLEDAGYVEGIDYLNLPYLAGEETLYAAMGSDFKKTYDQTPSSELWDSISGVKSFSLVIVPNGGRHPLYVMAHISTPHAIDMIASITAVVLPNVQPYFNSGQIGGVVSGMNGAAEYESLVQVPGKALQGMDAQSLGHLWIIVLVVLGNIGYFATRGKKAGGV